MLPAVPGQRKSIFVLVLGYLKKNLLFSNGNVSTVNVTIVALKKC